jgi:hypothetical protein
MQLRKLESLDQCTLTNTTLNYRMIEASGAKYDVQDSVIPSFGEGVGGVELRSHEPNVRKLLSVVRFPRYGNVNN